MNFSFLWRHVKTKNSTGHAVQTTYFLKEGWTQKIMDLGRQIQNLEEREER